MAASSPESTDFPQKKTFFLMPKLWLLPFKNTLFLIIFHFLLHQPKAYSTII
ncbi:uncharacterized protein FFB20_13998 [Fusarium fujikuroi]|nr:uncharacterized protein FFB20_13998 [Fusarium fujikuroi]